MDENRGASEDQSKSLTSFGVLRSTRQQIVFVTKLVLEYAKIWPNITVKKAPPPDSKEWEGMPDKLQYFSPNPGAGD